MFLCWLELVYTPYPSVSLSHPLSHVTLQAGGGGGIGAVSAVKLQALQDQLDVAQLQLKALTR